MMRLVKMVNYYVDLEHIGGRELARQANISPSAVKRFLAGQTPHDSTTMKLLDWCIQQEGITDSVDKLL